MNWHSERVFGLVLLLVVTLVSHSTASDIPWKRHTIDDSSQGADGVRLADVNNDGHQDVCTGWEEGGLIRVYLNPGPENCRSRWPFVTVGEVAAPEDAVFCDLDNDGAVDVVSCCEQKNRSVYFHWAPKSKSDYLTSTAWKTAAVPSVQGAQMWMYCVPADLDGQGGTDLVIGSKMWDGSIGWLQSPANPRDTSAWTYHRLADAGWIMSLELLDMDGDGDNDILSSDRTGERSGVGWLENPGPAATASGAEWKSHHVGGRGRTVMFLEVADLNRDGLDDIVCTTRSGRILYFERASPNGDQWKRHRIANPFGVKLGKAVAVADVNLDGRLDLAHTANLGGSPGVPACTWMELGDLEQPQIEATYHDLGGPRGYKYDLIEMIDLDHDGDLDLLTCEERHNLGVIWYENPTR